MTWCLLLMPLTDDRVSAAIDDRFQSLMKLALLV